MHVFDEPDRPFERAPDPLLVASGHREPERPLPGALPSDFADRDVELVPSRCEIERTTPRFALSDCASST